MYKVRFGETIEKGDLIAIANGNDFSLGIYYGRGIGGTVQYYMPNAVKHCMERFNVKTAELTAQGKPTEPLKLNRFWKCYINTPRDTRIMKLNRENITNQIDIEDIRVAKEALKNFNIDVKY
jgi:hypothetical protein